MQTREAEAVETKVTVATEEIEREEIMSQKERPPHARLSAVCRSSAACASLLLWYKYRASLLPRVCALLCRRAADACPAVKTKH